MRTISKPLFLLLLFLLAAAWGALDAHAAMIPQEWSVEVSRIKQYQFEANRGDTMELKATFWHKGEPFDLGGDTFRLYWQTNGMDSVYWSAAAVSASNTVSAVFANTMDPGAPIVYGFLGATSGNYRASFAIRYAPGPGAVPNALPLPAKSIDFAQVEVFNAPWTKEIESLSVEIESNRVDIASLTDTTSTLSDSISTLNDSISTLNDTKASKADATLTERGFSEWTITATNPAFPGPYSLSWNANQSSWEFYSGSTLFGAVYNSSATAVSATLTQAESTYVATRTVLQGYRLGPNEESNPNRDKPLASEAEAAANRAAISDLTDTTSTINDSISTINATKADRSELAGYATPADVYRIVAGTNVILVITNYNSTVHAPSMKLQHLDPETGEYVTYWDEARGHGITLTNAMDYADGVAARLDAEKAPRAWSRVTSGLGADAPEGTTFISTPVTHISGGFEFEKKITAGGTVWTLCSTSLAAGSTTNGFFEISALDGTPVFSVEKTDSVLVGVNASAIAVVDNACVISVPAVADTHPFARVATTLVNPTWYKETEEGMPAGAPASVTWSGQSGAWVATVDFGATPQGFVFFEYLQEGGVKIVNSAVVDLSQGVHYGGATYMPTVSGNELKFIRQ